MNICFIAWVRSRCVDNLDSSTIFSVEGNTVVATSKPLDNKFIRTNLANLQDLDLNRNFLRKQYGAEIFEMDRIIYQNINKLYTTSIRDKVENLTDRNESGLVILLGPSDSGKSFILYGDKLKNENGILEKAMIDILQNTPNRIKLSSCVVDNEALIDIFGKMEDQEHTTDFTTTVEVSTIEDFHYFMDEIKVYNKLKKNTITSIILEDKHGKRTQLDFLEIASSEYGLPSTNDEIISDEFNSVLQVLTKRDKENILNHLEGSVLLQSIKSTLLSDVVFIACLIPDDLDSVYSKSGLKYVELIRQNTNLNMKKSTSKILLESNTDRLSSEISILKNLKNKIKQYKSKRFARKNEESAMIDITERPNILVDAKLSDLEKSLKISNAKLNNIEKSMRENQAEKSNYLSPNQTQQNFCTNLNESSCLENLKQENTILKSDNMIYREDINYLSELNRNIENELSFLRKKNMDLIQQNEAYQNEMDQKQLEIEKLTEAYSRLKLYDNPDLEAMVKSSYIKDRKIKELECEIREFSEDKNKFIFEKRIFEEKMFDLKKNNSTLENEINTLRHRESIEIETLEEKVDRLNKQLEYITKENQNIRINDEKFRFEINNLNKQKNIFEEKYIKKKDENKENKKIINDLENQLRYFILEKSQFENTRKFEDDVKRDKQEKKQKILEEMQSKISLCRKNIERLRIVKK